MLNKLVCLFILSLIVINPRATGAENNWICIENANGEWECGDGIEPVVEKKPETVKQAAPPQAPTFLRARKGRQLPFMPIGSSDSQVSTMQASDTLSAKPVVTDQSAPPTIVNESENIEDKPAVQVNPIQTNEPVTQQKPLADKKVNLQEPQAKQEMQQVESKPGVNPGSSLGMARKYFVQLISVREPEGLDAIKSKLKEQGIQWVSGSVDINGATWWVLGVGPFAHYKQSKQALNRWQQDYPGAWIRKISQIQE
ncbi:MAG: SPOR domain-containing protein [bacterium]